MLSVSMSSLPWQRREVSSVVAASSSGAPDASRCVKEMKEKDSYGLVHAEQGEKQRKTAVLRHAILCQVVIR